MPGLYPLSRQIQLDANGELMPGARLFLFQGGTTTPISGFKDIGLSSPHPNPILADATGRLPQIFLDDGFYRQRLTDAAGTMIFDDDGIPVLSSGSGGAGTSVDPDALYKTRDIKIRLDNQPLDGYVRLNGRSIGSAISGATERANADTRSLYEEMWTLPNTTFVDGSPKGSSAAADFDANRAMYLPDCAGRGIFGMDDLGAGAKNRLTTLNVANPTWPASFGGLEKVTITQAQLPNYVLYNQTVSVVASGETGFENQDHTHFGSGTTGDDFPDHTHTENTRLNGATASGVGFGDTLANTVSTPQTGGASNRHKHSYSFNTLGVSNFHKHFVTVNGQTGSILVNSGGSGQAVATAPPLMTFMIYVRL